MNFQNCISACHLFVEMPPIMHEKPVFFFGTTFKGWQAQLQSRRPAVQFQAYGLCSTPELMRNDSDKGIGMSLAKSLASVLDESPKPVERRPLTRMELKRLIESRVKKRVKEQYVNGKFHDLLAEVIATPKILREAYDCIRLDSNIDLSVKGDDINFESIAKELLDGGFDVKENTFSIATKGEYKKVLSIPNLKLKVVQEAIRIVVDVVYRPHFSKISHGCRSGRGCHSALKYIMKEISDLRWGFTLHVKKKVDDSIFTQLISIMEDRIDDPSLYSILQNMFDADVLNLEFGGFPKGQGLPQEGVLSPTLMNIYLDQFDQEVYRIRMRYEALGRVDTNKDKQKSTLRNWFRRQLKEESSKNLVDESSSLKLHACRFMDEVFVAISGSNVKDAVEIKSDMQKYLQSSLHLDVDVTEVLPIDVHCGIHFLGTVVRIGAKESPAVRAVHKLKDKVQLFASQKQEIWDTMATRIGKRSIGHGLKKVKESEIKQLADGNSILSRISHFRKAGMETDHWFMVLTKIWMQDLNARAQHSEEETATTLALLPDSVSNQSTTITEILAPIDVIRRKLLLYGLVNGGGYPRPISALILQDNIEIIHWFSGLVRRWLKWFNHCTNFVEVKAIIIKQVRMSCIKTLAAKHRIPECDIEKQFELELSGIPATEDFELEMEDEKSHSLVFDEDEALNYGISHCGLCLLSLTRLVSPSRPCECFIMGCRNAAPSVYTLNIMERQKFPGWKTGFSVSIHPSLNRRRFGLCNQHVRDLYIGRISLQSIDFGSWK
ncbi:hypothetical protein C5167_005408 [Papaver somniferum]|uniref:Domain X domain-containing protein n=1 Tax=Papaver somniferum TaxID=3469 RepID=A0A4Y7JDH5_PAPSO|nr:hypothetical protein C5167_005408 [Papaver somniferum]